MTRSRKFLGWIRASVMFVLLAALAACGIG